MKLKMTIIGMIAAYAASLRAMEICSGESIDQVVDLRHESFVSFESITYNSAWVGSDLSAEVVISANGAEVKRTTGEGEFSWTPTTPGKHTLTYTTYINGVAQDEVYTATVFKDWKYTVEDGKATIVATTQTSGDVTIPSEIDGCPVVALGDGLFNEYEGITSITIPDSVLTVGSGVFDGCTGIKSCSVPSALLVGAYNAGLIQVKFNSSDDFTSSILDSEMKSLVSGVLMADAYDWESPSRTYSDPKYGGSYQWNYRNTTFGYAGYMYMVKGRTYVFGKYFDDSVYIKIGDTVVLKNTDHTAFATGKYIPNKTGWHEIEVRVADGNGEKGPKGAQNNNYWSGSLGVGWRDDGITDALPESGWNKMMDPGDGTLFRWPEEIQDLTMRGLFPDSYDRLTNVTLTGEEKEIPDNAFAGCAALETFVTPDGVTQIGDNAFSGCTSLKEIVIPDSVKSLGSGTFSGCPNILNVTIGCMLDSTLEDIFPDSYDKLANVTLADGVTEIPDNAFAGCAALQNVIIPESTVNIGKNAFDGCTFLVSIDFPDCLMDFGVDSLPPAMRSKMNYNAAGLMIYDGWVLDCNNKSASSLTIPQGIVGIGRNALSKMHYLQTISLPSTLKHIAAGAFGEDSYLDNLVLPDSVETIGDGTFEDCSYLQTLTVGKGVRTVGARAFAGCSQLSRVAFPGSLLSVGDSAFVNCWRMQSVSFPLTVTNVANTAFTGCSSLTGVTVPTHEGRMDDWFAPVYWQIKDVTVLAGETVVRDGMFDGCSSLTTIEMPEGIAEIGDRAFRSCSALSVVRIPETVSKVGKEAFVDCSCLNAAVLPERVVEIGEGIYSGCSSLSELTLSRALTAIPARAFAGCSSLDSFVVPAAVTNLGERFVSSRTTAIYYLGNAPICDVGVYDDAGWSLKSYVIMGTMGWDGRPFSRDIPQSWNGRDILTWSANRFDVTFDANGGRFEPVTSVTYACEQITYTGYSLPPFEPTRAGYKFNGYWTERSGGTRIFTSTRVSLTKAHTLYAHWVVGDVVKVRFNANGGTVSPKERDYTAEAPYGGFPVPTREHYVFTGWYTEASRGERVVESSEVPKANHELFAHWTPCVYTIRFHANNGTGSTASQSFTYGETVTLRRNTFYLSGCQFAGWSLTPGGAAVYADGKTLTDVSTIRDGIINLYAVWTGNTYSVRFDSHGGVGQMANQTFVVGVSQSLSACTFTRSGYRFAGWALSTTSAVKYSDRQSVCNLTTVRNGTVVLYAVWTANSPTPSPTPTPTPTPTPGTDQDCDYTLYDDVEGDVPETAASVYDGYLYDGDQVSGTIQAKLSKPKLNKKLGVVTAKTSVTIQISGEKKISLKSDMDVDAGVLEIVARDGRELYLEFGEDGMFGEFDSYEIEGARNFFTSKDKAESKEADALLAPWIGALNMITDGGTLSVTVAKKGTVTVKGTVDGVKVSAKAQALIGEDWICIPVVYSKKSVNLAFTLWLPLDGGETEVVGLDAEVGKAGTLKAGAKFHVDDEILAEIDGVVEYDGNLILPNGESVSASGNKWVVAGGAKAAKVAYKKGVLTITPGKRGGEVVNASGLKLSYKAKDGSFSGSFTVYALEKGKLKKHKASVSGILIDGIGYGTATINKFGTWTVEIR